MTTPVQKPGLSKQDYRTPKAFLVAVKNKLKIEKFVVDLAADEFNTVEPRFYSAEDNALVQSWDWWSSGEWAWLNPPYANIRPWVEKAYLARGHIAMLVPASVGANWWKEWVHRRAKVLFLNGRLAFMPDKPTWLYPKDCALLLYSRLETRVYENYDIWTWRS
mgnify:CR=1 FL=1